MVRRPRDPNQLAEMIVDIATGQPEDTISEAKPHPGSVRGRVGGMVGGAVRAQVLSSRKRSPTAAKAAKARWKNR